MSYGQFYTLDANGIPVLCDLDVWDQMSRNIERRRVARTQIGDVVISTVFTGHDSRYGQGPPVLWETMTFGGPLSDTVERYSSREDALAGHHRAVQAASDAGVGTRHQTNGAK